MRTYLLRIVLSAASFVAAGGMFFGQLAHAQQAEVNTASPVQASAPLAASAEFAGLQAAAASMLQQSAAQSPEVKQAVQSLFDYLGTTGLAAAKDQANTAATASWGDSTEKKKFPLPALAVGCGLGDLKVSGAFATVQPGPNYGAGLLLGKNNLLTPYIPSGHALFHIFAVDEQLAPVPEGTDVKVAWLNLKTFKGGITPLADTVLNAGVNAQTSATVETGDGPVIAAIAGKIAYRNGDTCTVLPTVGSTTVK